jgi:sugar phosphate isomerase/epimerase
VRVGIRTQVGRLSEDPDTILVLCNNVAGLGVTLDPSHFICRPDGKTVSYDKLLKHIYHVHLRDSTKEKLQVRVGQGLIEYGRLTTQLAKVNYNHALTVHILPQEGVDHVGEMRKLRLLLESLM